MRNIFDLPKLKTRIQLAGLAITIGAAFTAGSLLPAALSAQIAAAGIVISFLGFGLSLPLFSKISFSQRLSFINVIFRISCSFVLR